MDENITSDCEIENQHEMDYDYGCLPSHVVSEILLHLPIEDFRNASLASKSWYYASCDPRIARNLMLIFQSEPTENIDVFVRPFAKLQLEYLNFDKFNYRKLLREFGHKITELHINSCSKMRITQLFEIFIHLSNLKVLRIEYGNRYYRPNNFYKHRRITQHKARIMRNLGRVEELYINTTEKNLKGAEILLNYCTNLKILHWNDNQYHEDPDYFLLNVAINPNNNCIANGLEHLTVHSIDRKQNSKFFEHLINLNRTCLRSLDLKEISETYYDVVFKEFCKTYKSLERLTMYGCNNKLLADICKYMRNLKTLRLEYVTVTNFEQLGSLTNLETVKLNIMNGSDDSLIEYFQMKQLKLTDLTVDNISAKMLNLLCENLPNLTKLRVNALETKDCNQIFRKLTKLVYLHLEFTESTTINSSKIVSDEEWNITKLCELEDLFVTTFIPGITPDLIKKLPKLKSTHHQYVYDPTEPSEEENANDEEQDNDDGDPEENNNDEEAQQVEENIEEVAQEEVEEEDENREFDLTEFEFYSDWFSDTALTVIC